MTKLVGDSVNPVDSKFGSYTSWKNCKSWEDHIIWLAMFGNQAVFWSYQLTGKWTWYCNGGAVSCDGKKLPLPFWPPAFGIAFVSALNRAAIGSVVRDRFDADSYGVA